MPTRISGQYDHHRSIAISLMSPVSAASGTAPTSVAGKIVFLDPGHQASMEGLSRQVPTGRGGTKDCQASGTTAMALEERYGVESEDDPETNRQIFASVKSLADFVTAQRAA